MQRWSRRGAASAAVFARLFVATAPAADPVAVHYTNFRIATSSLLHSLHRDAFRCIHFAVAFSGTGGDEDLTEIRGPRVQSLFEGCVMPIVFTLVQYHGSKRDHR